MASSRNKKRIGGRVTAVARKKRRPATGAHAVPSSEAADRGANGRANVGANGGANGGTDVGAMLRALRVDAGLTQDALALAAACSKAYLSLVESGQRSLSIEKARAIEAALDVHDGRLQDALIWQRVPPVIRDEVARSQSRSRAMTERLRAALRSSQPLASLRDLIENEGEGDSQDDAPAMSQQRDTPGDRSHHAASLAPLSFAGLRTIPIINKVAAGYPREFTDLGSPPTSPAFTTSAASRAAFADEDTLACPDVTDPDAFAARVVGDSMEPDYHEGDIVVFSPAARLDPCGGVDCFVRLERDAETTFKRIYFEDEGRMIRLQPLNSAYPPRSLPREDVAGLYAAVYVLRRVGGKR